MKLRKVKVILVNRGISKKSGNPYCQFVVREKKEDGAYRLRDYWLSEDMSNQLVQEGIEVDDIVDLSFSLDEQLHVTLDGVEKSSDDEDDFFKGGE
jgi:hypothetical protein